MTKCGSRSSVFLVKLRIFAFDFDSIYDILRFAVDTDHIHVD